MRSWDEGWEECRGDLEGTTYLDEWLDVGLSDCDCSVRYQVRRGRHSLIAYVEVPTAHPIVGWDHYVEVSLHPAWTIGEVGAEARAAAEQVVKLIRADWGPGAEERIEAEEQRAEAEEWRRQAYERWRQAQWTATRREPPSGRLAAWWWATRGDKA